jgi:hypothetical protein
MAKALDAEIDRLFQLPLGEFTAARNATAKAAGKEGAAIKQLAKPPVAAWAVNQLFWSRRDEYEALIGAAEEMRRTNRAVIEGKRGDLRAAGREHERALDTALKVTLALMKDSGQPVTDATRHAILNTLRALPADERPGRLTHALTPGGFEMLSGITPAKTQKTREPLATPVATASMKKDQDGAAKQAVRARAEREAAERTVRDAEHKARRAEFEAARAARDADRAEKRVDEAKKAVEEAREELEAAESASAKAIQAREISERKSRDAESALEAARGKLRA